MEVLPAIRTLPRGYGGRVEQSPALFPPCSKTHRGGETDTFPGPGSPLQVPPSLPEFIPISRTKKLATSLISLNIRTDLMVKGVHNRKSWTTGDTELHGEGRNCGRSVSSARSTPGCDPERLVGIGFFPRSTVFTVLSDPCPLTPNSENV